MVKASPNYGTTSVAPAYIVLCHTDCEGGIRDMEGFKPVEDYGSGMTPYPGEIGKVDAARTNPDGTRVGWERLLVYFRTAFGGRDVTWQADYL